MRKNGHQLNINKRLLLSAKDWSMASNQHFALLISSLLFLASIIFLRPEHSEVLQRIHFFIILIRLFYSSAVLMNRF